MAEEERSVTGSEQMEPHVTVPGESGSIGPMYGRPSPNGYARHWLVATSHAPTENPFLVPLDYALTILTVQESAYTVVGSQRFPFPFPKVM